jgi:hypothetical protein
LFFFPSSFNLNLNFCFFFKEINFFFRFLKTIKKIRFF